MKLEDYFWLRPKSSPLLKEILWQKKTNRPRVRTFPKNIKPLWAALPPTRLEFRPYSFYSNFFHMTPHPMKVRGNFFRLQARVFVVWYEYAAKRYTLTLDFGIKQKKTLSERGFWYRPTGGDQPVDWWVYLCRLSSFPTSASPFFQLNRNSSSPFFALNSYKGPEWYEESLPILRRWAWLFHSRINALRSDKFFLSQSVFDERTRFRKNPFDSTSFWLASPIHDYSSFVKGYTSNSKMVLPERYFQFCRQRRLTSRYWSQLLFGFWNNSQVKPAAFTFTLPRVNFVFYFKTRILFRLLSVLPRCVLPLTSPKVAALGVSPWIKRILPVRSRGRKFFYDLDFFLPAKFLTTHRNAVLPEHSWNNHPLRLSGVRPHRRLKRLLSLLPRIFYLYIFQGPKFFYHWLLLWLRLLHLDLPKRLGFSWFRTAKGRWAPSNKRRARRRWTPSKNFRRFTVKK